MLAAPHAKRRWRWNKSAALAPERPKVGVGPTSVVKLNKFVYYPNKSSGAPVIELSRGAFRFATGSQSKGSYKVKTPYGTLGIRG